MNAGKQRQQHIRSTPSLHTTEQNSAKEAVRNQPWRRRPGGVGWGKSWLDSCLPLVIWRKRSRRVVRSPPSSSPASLQSQQAAGGWVSLWGEGSDAQPRHWRAMPYPVQYCGEWWDARSDAGPSPLAASTGCKELTARAVLCVRGCQGNSAAELGPKGWGPDLFFLYSEHQLWPS